MNKQQTEEQLRRNLLADKHVGESFSVCFPSVGVDANWHVVNGADTACAHCYGFANSIDQGEALARRISAALNYCKGIPTDHLLSHADGLSQGAYPAHQPPSHR